MFDGFSSLLVFDLEYIDQRMCRGIRLRPTGQGLCDRVHESHVAQRVGGDHGVPDAGQRRVQPLTLFLDRCRGLHPSQQIAAQQIDQQSNQDQTQ